MHRPTPGKGLYKSCIKKHCEISNFDFFGIFFFFVLFFSGRLTWESMESSKCVKRLIVDQNGPNLGLGGKYLVYMYQ